MPHHLSSSVRLVGIWIVGVTATAFLLEQIAILIIAKATVRVSAWVVPAKLIPN